MAFMWNGYQYVNVPDGTMNAMGNMPNPQMGGQMPYNGYQGQPMNNFQGQHQQAPTNANNGVQPQTNIIRVHGLDGAMNYPFPNNYVGIVYDNEKDLAYYVTVDTTGKRDVKTMDLSEHKDEPPVDYSAQISEVKKEIEKTNESVAKLREEFTATKPTKKNLVSGD